MRATNETCDEFWIGAVESWLERPIAFQGMTTPARMPKQIRPIIAGAVSNLGEVAFLFILFGFCDFDAVAIDVTGNHIWFADRFSK